MPTLTYVELHRIAMDHVDRSQAHLYQAYIHERAAARGAPDIQPTKAVLYRSAATLALEYGALADARDLANKGLASRPPTEIEAELRALLTQINNTVEQEKNIDADPDSQAPQEDQG